MKGRVNHNTNITSRYLVCLSASHHGNKQKSLPFNSSLRGDLSRHQRHFSIYGVFIRICDSSFTDASELALSLKACYAMVAQQKHQKSTENMPMAGCHMTTCSSGNDQGSWSEHFLVVSLPHSATNTSSAQEHQCGFI